METLTADQFKQKYGVMGSSQFTNAQKKQQQEESLFGSIKSDLANRAQQNVDIFNEGTAQGDNSLLHNTEVGTKLAANTFGGVADVIGESVKRIPVVGSALQKGTEFVKGKYDELTKGLGNTSLFQNAAKNIPEGGTLDKSLNIAKSGGDIATTILGSDVGVGGLKAGSDVAKTIPGKTGETLDAIPKPNLGAAGKYVQGAVRDVVPTNQNLIDHNLATALNLTPGDLANISKSTGNEVGTWMADHNLIGTNRANTQAMVDNFLNTNYKSVRDEIGKVQQTYKPSQVPRYTDALKSIQNITLGIPGLEKENAAIENLLNKESITLSEIQNVKEMLDDHSNLYNKTGDVLQGVTKQGLANVRGDLRQFIEQQVQKYTGADIREMNNNVATAKSLSNAITQRVPRGITRGQISWRDAAVGMGLTYFGSPIIGIAAVTAMKIISSPTVRLRFARWLDSISDAQKAKVSEGFKTGDLPKEAVEVINGSSKIPTQ